ncbi:hypothetical protein, partial [Streptomyces sp. F8]|uniref:hypothetical protein n=1 Tax=Streptomyces sp. F8 TaxID=1436085 RepID=UPI0029D41226
MVTGEVAVAVPVPPPVAVGDGATVSVGSWVGAWEVVGDEEDVGACEFGGVVEGRRDGVRPGVRPG